MSVNNTITIGIVTFKERKHLAISLVKDVRRLYGDDFEIVLVLNNVYGEVLDATFRDEMLKLCLETKNCYPIFCPEFKSLSKIWNTISIFARTEYSLILSDDVICQNADALNIIENHIKSTNSQFFRINHQFAHFVVSKTMLHKLGYFDERLLTFGEEDGDMVHRYIEMFGKDIEDVYINGIIHATRYDLASKDIETHVDNKPTINRRIVQMKYVSDAAGICGMSPIPLKRVWEDLPQYPYERFVAKNIDNFRIFKEVRVEYE